MSTNFYAVDSEDEEHWKGIHLGKRSAGWVFQFKWHGYCENPVGEHYYRNIDEFEEFVREKVVKDQYRNVWDSEEFIDMVENWCEKNDREPHGWNIDGYYFVKGDWS